MKKEKIVKVAVQMDKLSKINKDTDSTLALIKEALKRKFSVFIYTVDNMYLSENKLKAFANQVIKVNIKKEEFFELEKPKIINLNSFEFNEFSKIDDFAEWDSLAHINIITQLESMFNIRFSLDEVESFAEIKDIIKSISSKI